MESASDRRRRLARERLQRCHLADIKLFFPLAFSHSRSPAYVCTALLVHVTMQIFVVVLVVVVFVVSCNWFFPANHKSVSVLFLFTMSCILYCIAFLLLHEAFLRMRIPSYCYNYCEVIMVVDPGHINPDLPCINNIGAVAVSQIG